MGLVVFLLDGSAQGVERVMDGRERIGVVALDDDVLAGAGLHGDEDAEVALGLMAFLGDRHLAFTKPRVEAAERLELLGDVLFKGRGAVDAVEYDLQRLGHRMYLSFYGPQAGRSSWSGGCRRRLSKAPRDDDRREPSVVVMALT